MYLLCYLPFPSFIIYDDDDNDDDDDEDILCSFCSEDHTKNMYTKSNVYTKTNKQMYAVFNCAQFLPFTEFLYF